MHCRSGTSTARSSDCTASSHVLHTCVPQERYERSRLDGAWRKERKQYGRTAGGQYVDREPHTKLVDMGYDRCDWHVITLLL